MIESNKIKERLIELRNALGLKQYQLAERLGVTNTAVCAWESGRRNITEQTILSICREFRVNYFWITEGKGEIFTGTPETLIDEIVEEYNLDDFDRKIIIKYIELSENERNIIKQYLKSIIL